MRKRFFTILLFLVLWPCGMAQTISVDYARHMAGLPTELLIEDAKKNILAQQPRYDKALLDYTVVINRYDNRMSDEEKRNCAKAFNNAGYIYFYHYFDYTKAYSCFTKSLEISKQISYIDNLSAVYVNIGNMYAATASLYESENLAMRSIDYYKQAYHAAIQAENWDDFVTSFCNMSTLALSMNKVNLIDQELKVFKVQHVPTNLKMYNFSQSLYESMMAYRAKDYHKTLTLLGKAEESIHTKNTPERFRCVILASKAFIYNILRLPDEEEKTLKQYESIVDSLNIVDLKVENRKMLCDFYASTGNKKWADYYHLIYIESKDSLMTQNNLQQVSEMQFLNEIHQIDSQLKDVSTEKRQITMILWFVGIIAVLLAIFFMILYRNYKELDRRNRILYEKTQEMLQKEEQEKQKSQLKVQNSFLKDNEKQALMSNISKVFANPDEICSEEFSLDRLSQLVDSKPRYVSQTINDTLGVTFTNWLTDARIKEACKRLNDVEHYGNLTIEAVAQSVGFKSRSTFIKNFKSITGLTPGAYLKLAKRQ